MHRVPRLVGQSVQAVDIILPIIHEDKGIGIITTGRVGPASFALVFIAVHPSVLQHAFFNRIDIIGAQRFQRFGNFFRSFLITHMPVDILYQRNATVVYM
jgi:hypothetical protein